MPGLTAVATSASAKAVREKFVDIVTKHNDSLEKVEELHDAALDDVVQAALQAVEMADDEQAEQHARHFLEGRATLFRFFRRSRYSQATALDMLTATLTWRLRTDLDSLALSSLHPLYVSPPGKPPLFWANTGCFDRFGRPAGVISLQSLERVTRDDGTGSLDECREYIVGCMEGMRRYLDALYAAALQDGTTAQPIGVDAIEASKDSDGAAGSPRQPLQMVIIFSLQSSGMANLELELLPFLLDLLKNHFPGMVGAVYVIHFGWVHSGMWALAKRILPQQALARIFFPSNKDMLEHFNPACLPEVFGGDVDVKLTSQTNDVMRKFAQPRWERNKALLRKGQKLTSADAGADGEALSDEDEAMSAPASPRGLSGASTPRTTASRSLRAHSRAASFDSLAEDFYSLSNSPWNSRSATPWSSRPGTPFLETAGFQMSRPSDAQRPGFKTPEAMAASSSNGALCITPSAATKLRNIQRARGEPSGPRSRTNSEALHPILNGDARSGATSPADRRSPVVSRPTSPDHIRRKSTGGRGLRSVHFGNGTHAPGAGLGLDVPSGDSRPVQRVGSLRDFRLIDGDNALGRASNAQVGHDSSGDESEKSGKAGEMASQDKQRKQDADQQARGFFARFRRSPKPADKAATFSSSAQNGAAEKTGRDSDEDSLLNLSPEPKAPDSPRLQVADIEEPPLAETTRFFSRRSRRYSNLPGHVSPYNASNPFYGYPALPGSSKGVVRLGDAGRRESDATIAGYAHDVRRNVYHFRRRKRDLVRTLVYLFVLRLLAMHRRVRRAILYTYHGVLRAITVGGIPVDGDHDGAAASHDLQLQHERYERLRNAGTRFSMSGRGAGGDPATGRRSRDVRPAEQQAKRPTPQPLVALGMRRRYILLSLVVMFIVLRRYEWRRRRN